MSLSPILCYLLKFLSTKRASCSTCTTTSGINTWKLWSAATGHAVCELREELLPILFRGDRGDLWEGNFRDAVLSFLFYFYEIIPTLAINTHSLLRYPPSFFKQPLWDTLKWWRGLLDGLKADWFGWRQKVVKHAFASLRDRARLSQDFLLGTISRLWPVALHTA